MERASRPPCDGFPLNPALSRATMMTWLLTAFGTVLPLLLCTHVHFVHGDDPTSSLRSRGQQHGPDGIIVHLHIPKTAGAFLRQYMSQSLEARRHRNVPESEFFGYGLGGQGSFLAKSAEVQAQYGAVHGHIGYGMHQQPGWTRGLPRYTTVLRNPVDRIISQFQYEVRSPMGLAFGAKLPAKDSTTLTEGQLFEWFDDMQQHRTNHSVWSAHNNPMTQQLCCFKDDVGRPPFGPPCLNQPVNAETLACAVRNLVSTLLGLTLPGLTRLGRLVLRLLLPAATLSKMMKVAAVVLRGLYYSLVL